MMDIQVGDPNEGKWHRAHYPLPRHLGNHEILLLEQHHAVQGVLQSEEQQHPCIFGWERKFITNTPYIPLFEKWIHQLRSLAGRQRTVACSEEKLAEIAQAGGLAASLSKRKPIILTTPDGDDLYFAVMNYAAEKFNLCSSALSKVAKGRHSQHKGFKVRYVKEGEIL